MHRRFLLGFGAAFSLTGCAGTPTAYYRLASAPGLAVNTGALSISVRRIVIPAYLDQSNNIAKPGGPFEVNRFDHAEWAEPLADMLQEVMVQNLAQRLPAATVISDATIGAPARRQIEIDVQRFDFDPDGTILLNAQLAVRHGGSWTTTGFHASAVPSGPDAGAVAATMSSLWGEAADRVSAMVSDSQ